MATILCIGDSNTWGCPPFTDTTTIPDRLPKEQRWTGVLQSLVGPENEVIAEGLSGRTSVFDDPIEGTYKNASRTILASLDCQSPVGLVILMLGSNDFKVYFNSTSYTSARGILTLVEMIKGHYVLQSECPEILIVTPASILPQAEKEFWGDAHLRCSDHGEYLQQIADRTGCFHFDANSVVSNGEDGVHLDAGAHANLGSSLAPLVAKILNLPEY
ncbi:MAG: GDSL-type esterase/lipase family protein [Pseudomonadota bacterium]